MNIGKIAATLLLGVGMPGAAGVSFGATAQYTETETETEEVVAKAADDASKIVKFTEGPDWAPLDYRRNIEKGSALDFSSMPYFRGPAGAFGPVVVRNGHFEFEKLPGVPQRFYGANLCGSACFLDHALADEVAERFARMGFNSVRIHHHDGPCSKPGAGSEVELVPEMMDKLDYLVAALVKRGIYLETDLYVSRHASWRALGIDRDGESERYSRKALMTFYPPAYSNWCSFARAFLTHRNPYTGRTYAEEPAWVGIGLVNEGRFVFPFPTLPKLKPFQEKWRSWIKAKRKADPSCYPELGTKTERYPAVEWKDQKEMTLPQVCCDFSADLDREFFLKARKFLREELGCRAPLSNNNNSEPYAAMELVRDEIYDFCDTHDYFGGSAKTKPPVSTCNTNVFLAWNKLTGRTPWLRVFDKPVVVTEMNFPHPNPHRGGGLLTAGAIAAFQDYGAIWHFAYSHGDKKLVDRPYEGKSRFDLAADPLNALGVKLPFALFCRGDLEPARERCVLAIDEAAVHPKHGFGQYVYPPKWGREAAWLVRAGCCAAGRAPKDAKVFPLMDVVGLDAPPYRPAPEKALAFDGARGSLVVDTPRTAAGYVPEGTLVAGPFRAAFGRDFGMAAAIALDAQPLAQAARLLVLVLADVQFDGATYTDASLTSQLEKGTYAKPIVKVMRVPVRLDLASASDYEVYALDTAGRRTGKVETTVRDGALAFVASTRGPDGRGCLAWEVVRKQRDPLVRLQAEIDACAAKGGGTVTVPAGLHETAPLELKSNVELHLEDGAELLFTDDLAYYDYREWTNATGVVECSAKSLVTSLNATNVAITGRGTLRPRMGRWESWRWFKNKRRPRFVELKKTRGIRLEGFRLRHSPSWFVHLEECADVVIRGLDIEGYVNNNDGIDVDSTKDVLIEGCRLSVGDDIICMKSGKDEAGRRRGVPTENVLIRHCTADCGHAFLGIGSECSGGIRNVTMEDCEMDGTCAWLLRLKTRPSRGGFMENITMRNVRAKFVTDTAVQITNGYGGSSDGTVVPPTRVDGVRVENVTVREAKKPVFIDPSLNARNVVFDGLVVNGRLETNNPK